jgi:hypothetical protein
VNGQGAVYGLPPARFGSENTLFAENGVNAAPGMAPPGKFWTARYRVANGRSTFELDYVDHGRVVNPGTIVWTASFNDDDLEDIDEASVTTLVIQ